MDVARTLSVACEQHDQCRMRQRPTLVAIPISPTRSMPIVDRGRCEQLCYWSDLLIRIALFTVCWQPTEQEHP